MGLGLGLGSNPDQVDTLGLVVDILDQDADMPDLVEIPDFDILGWADKDCSCLHSDFDQKGLEVATAQQAKLHQSVTGMDSYYLVMVFLGPLSTCILLLTFAIQLWMKGIIIRFVYLESYFCSI